MIRNYKKKENQTTKDSRNGEKPETNRKRKNKMNQTRKECTKKEKKEMYKK